MILELAQLASRKLSEARACARQDVESWQKAAEVVSAAERESQHSITIPSGLIANIESAGNRISQSDYLTVLKTDERAVDARERILTIAKDSLSKAGVSAKQAAAKAKVEFEAIVLFDMSRVKADSASAAALASLFLGFLLLAA